MRDIRSDLEERAQIVQEQVTRGFLNERGKPYAAKWRACWLS